VTILGELVWPTGRPVWTSTLVHVLKGLGIEEQAARQAIARGGASDWIVAERQGRQVRWHLGARLAEIFDSGSARVFSLSDPFLDWDGQWLAALVNIPASHRRTRRPLYAGLMWAGLGNPSTGLWVTPHVERADEVRVLIDHLGLRHCTVSFRGSVDNIGISEQEIVQKGWDLETLRAHYVDVLAAVDDLKPEPGEDMLYAFLRMISEWQELPRTDPQLPEALLPGWVGRRVARRIEALRDQWTPEVRRTFAAIDERSTDD